jgi:hypothetical protein
MWLTLCQDELRNPEELIYKKEPDMFPDVMGHRARDIAARASGDLGREPHAAGSVQPGGGLRHPTHIHTEELFVVPAVNTMISAFDGDKLL